MKRNQFVHPRVIVFLLLEGAGAINTVKFKYDQYLGDPVNLVRIYNDKEADEMMIASKTASKDGINFKVLKDIASSARFPLTYCGGISSLDDASRIIQLGYEKVSLNSTYSPRLVSEIAKDFGTSCVSVTLDIKKTIFGGYKRFNHLSGRGETVDLPALVSEIESSGAGELILNVVDKDGTYSGYDTELLEVVSRHVTIPVVIAGGARDLRDMKFALDKGASALAATSIFVFYGAERGILPNYPSFNKLQSELR